MVTAQIHITPYSNPSASTKQECKYHHPKKYQSRDLKAEPKGRAVVGKNTGLVHKKSTGNCIKMIQRLLNKGTDVNKIL